MPSFQRPIWRSGNRTQAVPGKGKERATAEDTLSGESEVEEEEFTGSESEYEDVGSSDEHASDVEVEAVMVASTAGPSRVAPRVASQNKVKVCPTSMQFPSHLDVH